MKNGLLILMFALAGFAVFANYNHDGGKKGKKCKANKACCATAQAQATADGAAAPACCSKMKADGKKCEGHVEKGKSCQHAEGKPAGGCQGGHGHQGGAEKPHAH